jgi:cobalt-zinc-cadmium efflux system protein
MAHAHAHPPAENGVRTAFLVAVGLNAAFIVFEVVFGFQSGSLALLSDAGHNLGDVLGLLLAWGAILMARRAPSTRRTYGLRRSTILAALANAVVLLIAVGAVALEAVQRLRHPAQVAGPTVIAVAALGILVNGLSAWLLGRGRREDLNVRAAVQHLVADTAVSFGVVLAGVALVFTHWLWLDPLVSLLVSALIVVSTWKILRESLDLAMDAVPGQIDPVAVREYLEAVPGVVDVHDFHVWAMSTTETALTAHLVTDRATFYDDLTSRIAHDLSERFGIVHPTIQWEGQNRAQPCQQGRATLPEPAATAMPPAPTAATPGPPRMNAGQEDARHE